MNFIRLPLLCSFVVLGLGLCLRAADTKATGTLSVMSPEGAKVFIDGVEKGYVPVTLRDLPANKRFVVRVTPDGRPPVEREFTLAPGKVALFDADAPPEAPKAEKAAASASDAKGGAAPGGTAKGGAPATGGTAVVSILCQDGAAVLVDGTPSGYAPVTLRNLPANKPFTIRLELAGHESLERAFTLAAGKVETFEVELLPLHPGFEVTTLPGAEVVAINEQGKRVPIGFSDEKGVISSEGKISGLSCTLEISKPGYETAEHKLPLDLKNKVKTTVNLRPKPARLQIVSVPAVTEAFVNNVKRPVTRGILDVPADTEVTVEVKLDGYSAKSMKAKVGKGEETVLNFGNLDPLAGRVRVQAVTEQGPVPAEFHAKVRAFVDSREVPWNRGALVPLAPGKHEITLMHELYNVTGDGSVVVDVKESATADVTLKMEMKPARIRIAVQAKDQHGKVFKPAFALQLDGLPIERSPDDTYDVPAGREFTVSVGAILCVTAKRTFAPLAAGDDSVVWEPTLEWDSQSEQRRLRILFDAEMATLLQATETKMAALRKPTSSGPAVLTEARQWIAARRVQYGELEKRFPSVFVKSSQFEQNLVQIDKLADLASQRPKQKQEAPSPF